jgi:trehalose-6-phosphate hydrolase
MTVGEMSSTTIQNCILYTQPERNELSMVFNFHHLKVDYVDGQKWSKKAFDFKELKSLLHNWGEAMSENNGWNALFWNNHDQPRALNRFVDVENFRVEGAKMMAAAIHLNRGTPYVYMGEEIGMIDPDFTSMDDYVDIECLNAYQMLLDKGMSHEEAFEIVQIKSRDNSRTPMQWNSKENSGFSEHQPWLSVGNHYKEINVEEELATGTIHTFYKKLIELRKEYSVISSGTYTKYLEDHAQVFGYIREDESARMLVLNNFYGEETPVEIPEEFASSKVLIGNYENQVVSSEVTLRPYETIALYLGK